MDDQQKIVTYEWRLEQIRQYFAAWDAGELAAHKALEGINSVLAASHPDLQEGVSTLMDRATTEWTAPVWQDENGKVVDHD